MQTLAEVQETVMWYNIVIFRWINSWLLLAVAGWLWLWSSFVATLCKIFQRGPAAEFCRWIWYWCNRVSEGLFCMLLRHVSSFDYNWMILFTSDFSATFSLVHTDCCYASYCRQISKDSLLHFTNVPEKLM